MHSRRTASGRSGSFSVVIKKNPFNQQQASYFSYLRRYKDSEAMEGRVRFDDFLRHEHRLVENEFFIAGLRAEGKTRGGAMPSLIKQQRDLRALLLIEEEEVTPAEKFIGRVKRAKAEMQGPTGARVRDDDDMVAI
ncbi:hypothetical protein LCGC14_1783290 [marine sediment metagenome]|uniref:Uncharacterized protein n=1 Tax=marine sediment metagenome TaxID=412755 RepID=A0A0F9JUB6_9ZZZZ